MSEEPQVMDLREIMKLLEKEGTIPEGFVMIYMLADPDESEEGTQADFFFRAFAQKEELHHFAGLAPLPRNSTFCIKGHSLYLGRCYIPVPQATNQSVPGLRINGKRSGSKFHTGLTRQELQRPSSCRDMRM